MICRPPLLSGSGFTNGQARHETSYEPRQIAFTRKGTNHAPDALRNPAMDISKGEDHVNALAPLLFLIQDEGKESAVVQTKPSKSCTLLPEKTKDW